MVRASTLLVTAATACLGGRDKEHRCADTTTTAIVIVIVATVGIGISFHSGSNIMIAQ